MSGMFGATPRNDLLKSLYFTPPPKNEQYWRGKTLGTISKPQRSTQQTLGNLLANALTPVSGEKRARHVANRAVNALTDLTPVGGAVAAEDARRDWNQGNTLGAVFNGAMAALSALPGGGAELKSIIAPLWHGSPHKFEKFALDKIGTGEGAQSFGHGLYFAENPATAQAYREGLAPGYETKANVTLGGRTHDDFLMEALNSPIGHDDAYETAEAVSRLHTALQGWPTRLGIKEGENVLSRQQIQDAAKLIGNYAGSDTARKALAKVAAEAEATVTHRPAGHLYEVKLNAEPEDFLDWDAKLGDQPAIADRYKALDIPLIQAWAQNGALPHIKGETAYRQIAGGLTRGAAEKGLHTDASKTLKRAGIPGIRYLDQGSRGAGNGTRNYVVFDDGLIDILNRH